jgi:dTDP-4-dehydrorhamnose reductase
VKILVFGKDGQLGKAFRRLFDSLMAAQSLEIHYVGRDECDLLNEKAIKSLLEKIDPHLIINAAAYTAVDKAETEIDLAYAINARAPELMALYANKHAATLLHFSTDYVFDGSQERPYLESDARNPLGAYGKSKAAGEEAIERVFSGHATGRFAILRTSWVYGEGQNFIRTILRLAKDREQLKVIHDQHGIPTSARWLAQVGLDLVLDQHFQLRFFPSGIYHAVPNSEVSWYGLACLVVQVALDHGIMLKTTPQAIVPILALEYPLPAPRPKNSRLDNSKLCFLMGQEGNMTKLQHWNTPWDESVRQYVGSLAHDGLI